MRLFKVIIVLISLFSVSANAADFSKTPKEIDVDIKGAMPLPNLLTKLGSWQRESDRKNGSMV